MGKIKSKYLEQKVHSNWTLKPHNDDHYENHMVWMCLHKTLNCIEAPAFYIAGFITFKRLWNIKSVIYNNNVVCFSEELTQDALYTLIKSPNVLVK